jgi:GcrA cell cycle regulator
MDWTQEAIERLRAFWAEGLSTAEIGRRMGISKNAVVGKAHRLNLSSRPSPIRRDPQERRTTPSPRPPRQAPVARPMPSAPVMRPQAPAPQAAPVVLVAPPPAAVRNPAPPRPRLGGSRTCCWPIGEPGTPEFRFCEGDPLSGKPYCAEHAAVAYVKPREKERREDAA